MCVAPISWFQYAVFGGLNSPLPSYCSTILGRGVEAPILHSSYAFYVQSYMCGYMPTCNIRDTTYRGGVPWRNWFTHACAHQWDTGSNLTPDISIQDVIGTLTTKDRCREDPRTLEGKKISLASTDTTPRTVRALKRITDCHVRRQPLVFGGQPTRGVNVPQ